MAARRAARRWGNLQIEVVAGVTVRACRNLSGGRKLMQVLQRKTCGVVTPRRGPIRRGMATGALRRRKPGRNVIWNRAPHGRCAGVLVLVTAITIRVRRGKREVVVDMAGRAGRSCMNTSERPPGGAVVKCRGVPGNRVVTRRTVRSRERRTRRGMDWIVGRLPGAQVAAGIAAVCRLNGQRVIAADVALGATRRFPGGRQLVRVGQRESRRAVIKLAVRPNRDRMA